MARRELRFVPLLGALSVVLVVVGYLVAGDTPDHHALGPEIREDYDNETQHQISAFLVALGAVPLLFFAGYFRAVLTRLHPLGRLSPNVALAGAVVAATGLAVQSLIHAALAEAAQTSEFSDQALQSLNALDGWSFYPFAIGLSTFVLASGVALVRDRRFFAPFVGWAAVVLGVLALVPIVGFFAAILSGIWLVTVSVMLFVRSEAVDHLWDDAEAGPAATHSRVARLEDTTERRPKTSDEGRVDGCPHPKGADRGRNTAPDLPISRPGFCIGTRLGRGCSQRATCLRGSSAVETLGPEGDRCGNHHHRRSTRVPAGHASPGGYAGPVVPHRARHRRDPAGV